LMFLTCQSRFLIIPSQDLFWAKRRKLSWQKCAKPPWSWPAN